MGTPSAPAPLHAVVVGAGVGGLGAALALSRLGHRVTLVERDDTPMPADVEAAFDWDRRGAPQVRHTHGFLARLTCILRDRYPDVLQALVDTGAKQQTMAGFIAEEDAQPGDEDLMVLACRRTTFEWVLRRKVLEEAGVEVRVGDGMAALLSDPAAAVPTVTGVRLASGAEIPADLVVASTGRRGDVPSWLSAIGVEIGETEADTGIVYMSRFYRLHDGVTVPTGRPFGNRAGISYVGGEADNSTFSVTMAVSSEDAELRRHLNDDERYERTVQLLPELAAFRSPETSDPLTPVHAMGGLINRLRTFTGSGGQPLVLGFHAVGDAHTCTNPLYGRGCSLAMVQAALVADAVRDHPTDLVARSQAYEAACQEQVTPWYHISVMSDQGLKAAMAPRSGTESGTESGPGAPKSGGGGTFGLGLDINTLMKAQGDPTIIRTFMKMMNLLVTPSEVFADPDFMARVAALQKAPEPEGPSLFERSGKGPTRDDVLRAA